MAKQKTIQEKIIITQKRLVNYLTSLNQDEIEKLKNKKMVIGNLKFMIEILNNFEAK